MTMPLFLTPTFFREGEVLIFSDNRTTAQTVSALTGVSGNAISGVSPRLIICDTDSDGQLSRARAAHAPGIPVLFLAHRTSVSKWTPSVSTVIETPILFSDFRRATLTLLAGVPEKQPPSETPTEIRVENGTAVSGNTRVPLTPCEERILITLLDAYPHAATAHRLEESFARHGSNSVRVYITYLRKKLAPLPAFRAILAEKDGGFSLLLRMGAQNNG